MASELSFLSVFWILSAAVVFLIHVAILLCEKKLPEVFRATWLFGKMKSLNNLESKTPFPVPKSWFTHFYAIGLAVHSVVFTSFMLHLTDHTFLPGIEGFLKILRYPVTRVSETNAVPVVIVLTMEWIQMARRLTECLFTSSFSNSTMSPVHYILGIFFYTSFGLGLVSSVDIPNLRFNFISSDMVFYVPAAMVFLMASFYQHKAFQTFASLRKVEEGKPAKGHYIPRGHLFEWVSCPHYLCEIIVYCSLCLMFQMRSSFLNSVLFFVFVNQMSCGIYSHDWYKQTFKNYPKSRKAIIPCVL